MPIRYDISKDSLYLEGMEKGGGRNKKRKSGTGGKTETALSGIAEGL